MEVASRKLSASQKRIFVLEKIAWARRTTQVKCGGSPVLFRQEYPSTSLEAFVATGETIFDMEATEWYRRNTRCQPKMVGRLILGKGGGPEFMYDDNGNLKVWVPPELGSGMIYAIGADAALGQRAEEQKRADKRKRDADYSAAIVLSQDRRQVAQFRDRNIDPAEFAEQLALLGKWYDGGNGPAMVNPEVGSNDVGGYGVVYRLREMYPRICRWKKWDHSNPGATSQTYGFEINARTKPIILQEIMREVRRGAGLAPVENLGRFSKLPLLQLYSTELISELNTFSLDRDGGFGARKGAHDDLVISLGLALLALDDLPPYEPPRSQHGVAPPPDIWTPLAGGDFQDTDVFPAWASQ